jgi:cellulose synthase/poly-beta-1,6-N-acetylglucosamine synthase-like glycosyltransferase
MKLTHADQDAAMSGDTISIVVAAFSEERWPRTLAAVRSAQRQTLAAAEIVLVIDHNPDLYRHAAAQLNDVLVIESDRARGASGARNSGIAASRGEIVVFLDDDAVACSQWLEHLVRHFEDEAVVGVGGGITPDWTRSRPRWLPLEFDWVVGATYRGMPDRTSAIRNVWSGNMAVRRSALAAVSGFRDGFGKQMNVSRPEDTDLCLRVAHAHPRQSWIFEPRASVAHYVSPHRSTFKFFINRCWHEGRGKAALARLVGLEKGTSLERDYARRVLPRGLLRETAFAVRHLDEDAAKRAVGIVLGLSASVLGFAFEMSSEHIRRVRAWCPPIAGGRGEEADFVKSAALPATGATRSAGRRSGSPTVSIVICSYTEDRYESLLRATRSALSQTYPCSVIVVVDHNEDLLRRLERELPEGVQVVPSGYPAGASGSRNTGAFKGQTDLIAFLDDDANACPKWIRTMVGVLESPDVIGAGSSIIANWSDRPHWFPDEFGWVMGVTSQLAVTKPTVVRNVWSNGMVVDREQFEAAGGFDVRFGKVGATSEPEDTELCLRMSEMSGGNAAWIFRPDVTVYHEVPAERSTVRYFIRRCWLEGRGKASLLRGAASKRLALSEEVRYARTTVVTAFWRYLASAALGEPHQAAKALAVLGGFWITVAGFTFERASHLVRGFGR